MGQKKWKIAYDTKLTDDVIPDLSKQGVEKVLKEIKALRKGHRTDSESRKYERVDFLRMFSSFVPNRRGVR